MSFNFQCMKYKCDLSMQLTLDSSDSDYIIQGFEPGVLTINNDAYSESVLVNKSQLITPWIDCGVAELSKGDFTWVISELPEVFIIGTGTNQIFPTDSVLSELFNRNIGVEIMSTAAACRTFMVLLSEGRSVAAGLLTR